MGSCVKVVCVFFADPKCSWPPFESDFSDELHIGVHLQTLSCFPRRLVPHAPNAGTREKY